MNSNFDGGHFLHTVKWFQVLIYNITNFICVHFNGFKNCYLLSVILFSIIYSVIPFQVLKSINFFYFTH